MGRRARSGAARAQGSPAAGAGRSGRAGRAGRAGRTGEAAEGGRAPGDGNILAAALAAAEVGVWDWDIAGERLAWDRQAARIHGLDRGPESLDMGAETAFELVHPDDIEDLRASVARATRSSGSFVEEYRIRRPDGAIRWVQARGRMLPGLPRAARRMTGVVADTTRIRAARERVIAAFDHAGDGVVLLDGEDRFAFVNAEAERLLGGPRTELIGTYALDRLPVGVGDAIEEAYRAFAETGGPLEVETVDRSGGWVEVRLEPTAEFLIITLRDVDERHRVEVARSSIISAQSSALMRSRRLLAVTNALAQALTVEDLGEAAATALGDELGIAFVGLILYDEEGGPPVVISRPPSAAVDAGWSRTPNYGPGTATEVLRTGRPRFDRSRAEYVASYPERAGLLAATGVEACASLPLIVSGRSVGVLLLGWAQPREFDQQDRVFLETLAGAYAQTAERIRLYEEQTALVRTLARAVLPQNLPDTPGVALAARYLPASREAGVGGDWYDATELPDGELALVLGDVGGHGLGAIAVMSELHQAARAYALQGQTPAEITTQLAANLAGRSDESLATAVVARLAPRTGRLTWSCAGHPPPLLLVGSAAVYLDEVHGPILGAQPGLRYGQSTVELPPGACLLLYSDGLVERRGAAITDRLQVLADAVRAVTDGQPAVAGTDPRGLLEALCDRVLTDLAGAPGREDDLCLLILASDAGLAGPRT